MSKVLKISDRRQNANNFFLTLNTVLISVIGLSFQVKIFDNYSWVRVLIAVLGILICIIFWFLLSAYKQLNTGKFKVIHEIEQMLPLALYDYEWKILGEGKDKKNTIRSRILSYLFHGFWNNYSFLGIVFLVSACIGK